MTSDELRILNYCDSIWCSTFQCNDTDYINHYTSELIATDWIEIYADQDIPYDYGFRIFEITASSINDIVEYVIHLKCIYTILTVMSEFQIFNTLTGKISTYSVMDITHNEEFHQGIRLCFSNNDILTMNIFLGEIYTKWIK